MSLETVRFGVIGVGKRGLWMIRDAMEGRDGIAVTALCDLKPEKMEACIAEVRQTRPSFSPYTTTDYRELLVRNDVDVIAVITGWEEHVDLAIEAMEAKKPVIFEVGGAYCMEDCWRLVRAYERTGTRVMMMENCCFGEKELMALRMAREGLFGQIVHCQGGYRHNIRKELVIDGSLHNHYRLRNSMYRNGENYPTHELGPISKVLNINRGNRFLSLTSTASGAFGLREYAARELGPEHELAHYPFTQGDVVTTVLRCSGGQTVTLTLDTNLPRWYSRNFHIQGTKGLLSEENKSVYLEGNPDIPYEMGNITKYYEKYDHPMWRRFVERGMAGGHGGIDGLEMDAVAAAIRDDMPFPIDVYDSAVWLAITPLSEASIARGSAPVEFPDFTRGKWMHREPLPDWEYTLDYKV